MSGDRLDPAAGSNDAGTEGLAPKAPEPVEPIEVIEDRAYRALVRSLGWLCRAEIWKYTKCSRHKGESRDRLLLARMSQKAALQLLEIRKSASVTLARLLTNRVSMPVPGNVPVAGKEKLEELLARLDLIENFEDLDIEIKRLRDEDKVSRVDADALLDYARERFGIEPETEEEHDGDHELDDLMEAAVLQAAKETDEEVEEEVSTDSQ